MRHTVADVEVVEQAFQAGDFGPGGGGSGALFGWQGMLPELGAGGGVADGAGQGVGVAWQVAGGEEVVEGGGDLVGGRDGVGVGRD
jgi:hypothetical protein